jgi:DNA mismatch repair protein MutS
MCGIPASSADGMVARLLSAGHKVAISEPPPEPGGVRPLRLLTPGTTVDDAVLAAGCPNTLAVALAAGPGSASPSSTSPPARPAP